MIIKLPHTLACIAVALVLSGNAHVLPDRRSNGIVDRTNGMKVIQRRGLGIPGGPSLPEPEIPGTGVKVGSPAGMAVEAGMDIAAEKTKEKEEAAQKAEDKAEEERKAKQAKAVKDEADAAAKEAKKKVKEEEEAKKADEAEAKEKKRTGIIVGCVVGVGVLAVVGYLWYRSRRTENS